MYQFPKVDCCTAFKNAFKNYSNFSGRIRRSEYWFFLLVVNIVTFILLLFFILFETRTIYKYSYDYYYRYSGRRYNYEGMLAFRILLGIYVPFITLPTLSASARRLHDIGKSGCYLFIGFVPFFGTLTLLVYLCRDSMPEANEFGPPTKYTTNIINQTLQSPNQSYNAPLLPNDNNSINNVSSDNIIAPNNNINVVPNNNYIIVPNKNVIVPNNQYIVPNNQYIVPNNQYIVPNNNVVYSQNKNIIMPNQNINVVPNQKINSVPNININAQNNNTNNNNSKPVQMNELSEKKE